MLTLPGAWRLRWCRARQREASRQSRKRRRDQIAALIDTTRSLQAQNQQLLQQLAALSSQPHSASPGSNPTAAAAFIAHAGRLFNHTIAVLNTGNLQQIRAVVKSVLTEDCTLLHPDLSSEIKGSDKIAEYFERMIEHFPDFTLAISKLESDPASSTVCAHFVATGTQLRPFLPILPASKPVTLEVTGYFFMADGFVRKQLWLWNHTRLLLSLIGYANCDSTSVLGIDTADLTKPRPESAASAGAASSSTMSTPTATKSESSSRDAEDSRTAPAR